MPTGVYPRKPRKKFYKRNPVPDSIVAHPHIAEVRTDLRHSFSRKDGMVFGDFESQELGSSRVYFKVSVWFQSKDEAAEYFNKAGGAYVP